jgi:hypothetical protein
MRLTMTERKAVTKVLRMRYRRASKKEKGQLLDELVGLTGYHRCYAAGLLGGQGARREGLRGREERQARQRPRVYDRAVLAVLRQVWLIMDCICGKRLAAVLAETIAVLERHGELALETAMREKLGAISAATIDRLLAAERRRLEVRGRSGTKPGTLLRQQIPVRTFAEWDQTTPGFVEIDLVGHDGGLARGDFCQTLDVTDVASGWTETQAVFNKAQVWVFAALREIRARLPFALRGIDSDNGSEFINHELLRYAQAERITFTRGRAWKKNDGCFVEQKNYSVVRRAVGYARYEGQGAVRLLNALYRELRLYSNFFQPVMKLLRKERSGAKVKKTYDRPRTPYARLLASSALSAQAKRELRTQYAGLNPAALKRNICRLQRQLLESGRRPVALEATVMRYHSDTIPRDLPHGHDTAPSRDLGRPRASLRGRSGDFAQRPDGHSAARVSRREKARPSQPTLTAGASPRAGDRAASQGRASAAAQVKPLDHSTQRKLTALSR